MTMLNQDASKRLIARLAGDDCSAELLKRQPRDEAPSTLRGFGFTVTVGGGVRRWYIGVDGVRRWANNDQPADGSTQ